MRRKFRNLFEDREIATVSVYNAKLLKEVQHVVTLIEKRLHEASRELLAA